MKLSSKNIADLEIIKKVIENETAYSLGKNCSLSYQAVDKFKKGTADVMNMKLKHAIEITQYGEKLEEMKND